MKKDWNDLKEIPKVVGARQVVRGMAKGEIRKVWLAADAEPKFREKIREHAEKYGVEVIVAGTGAGFREVCGVDVDTYCFGEKK